MNSKYRIGILGIGGVGGFIGGMLADFYKANDDVEIIFIARGENLNAIKKHGLVLQRDDITINTVPSLASDNADEIGTLDLLICCVKGYSIEKSISKIKQCITENTIILPLLNGVDAPEQIRKIVPHAKILDGCIYIVSKIIEPGIVKESGFQHRIFAGMNSPEFNTRGFNFLKEAGLNVSLRENIENTVWEKFIFISPLATVTSYLNMNIGEILESEDRTNMLMSLLKEIKSVAYAKGIIFEEDIVEKSFKKMQALPYQNTTSMHNDFKKGGKTELESLTGYVVRNAVELNISVPIYEKLLGELREK